MRKIHSSAIVSKIVDIEEDVEIGAFSIIEENVKIGKGTKIASHCIIEKYTEIGENNFIGCGTILGGLPQDLKFKGEKSKVIIGDNNIIREYVTINRACGEGEATIVGNNNYLMTQVHLGHNCKLGNNIIITNATGLSGYVEVEDEAVISGLVGIHQFVRVGKLSMIGGLSAVRQDVPPYSLVAGNPCRLEGVNVIGLRRKGMSEEVRNNIKSAYKILFFSGLGISSAIEKLKNSNIEITEEVNNIIIFLKMSKRGVCRCQREN